MKRNNIKLKKWEIMHASFYKKSMSHLVSGEQCPFEQTWPRQCWPISNLAIERVRVAILNRFFNV
jgi:hypothetical protein